MIMTCKDCIHYGVCKASICEDCWGLCDECGLWEKFEYEICDNFKDKSKIIELPCNIGDKVYLLLENKFYPDNGFDKFYLEVDTVSYFDVAKIAVPKFRWNKYNIVFYSFSKEEAEAKLKELNKNAD